MILPHMTFEACSRFEIVKSVAMSGRKVFVFASKETFMWVFDLSQKKLRAEKLLSKPRMEIKENSNVCKILFSFN